MPDLTAILIALIVAFLILGVIGWWKTRRDPSWLYVDADTAPDLAAAETEWDARRTARLTGGDEWQALMVAVAAARRDVDADFELWAEEVGS